MAGNKGSGKKEVKGRIWKISNGKNKENERKLEGKDREKVK